MAASERGCPILPAREGSFGRACPSRDSCNEVRQMVGRFVEVYAKCPLEVLIERDAKGLYRKALRGEIQNFTGISDPYEEPLAPEVVVETNRERPQESLRKILRKLAEMNLIPTPVPAMAASVPWPNS